MQLATIRAALWSPQQLLAPRAGGTTAALGLPRAASICLRSLMSADRFIAFAKTREWMQEPERVCAQVRAQGPDRVTI